MNKETTSPYSLEVTPCERPTGHFQWSIRQRGRLLQRSDRSHATAHKARENGQEQIERLLHGDRR